MNPIYLDYNATTPLDPAVVETMLPYLRRHYGNPSSTHVLGREAHAAVETARTQVAAFLGAEPDEVIFTSGGTEASNHALKGVAFAKLDDLRTGKVRVVTSAIEHPATFRPCAFLERFGCNVAKVGVDSEGLIALEEVRRELRRETTLVSVMHSNNEVGTLQPIVEIAALARERGALMHTDAAQSLGKVRVNVRELGVDLLSVAGHKVYAPKGVGALYVRRGVILEPFMHGAGHESGHRAGTENVPNVVGLGKACELAMANLPDATEKLRRWRDLLWEKLAATLGTRVRLNGHHDLCLPNTLNVNFLGHVGSDLLKKVPEIAASTGSACHEGHVTLSPVLAAMGVPPEEGRGAVRLTVGRFTTEEEIERAAALLIKAAK